MDPSTVRCAKRRRLGKILALAGVLGSAAAPLSTYAQTSYHSECRVIDETHLEHFGNEGQPAELSHFTCKISGGPLDGFVVNGTNIWELGSAQATLIGSLAIAQKGNSCVVYEVEHVVRQQLMVEGRVIGRQGRSHGIFRAGTGSAVSLVGKTFTSVARRSGVGRFTIDSVVDDPSGVAEAHRDAPPGVSVSSAPRLHDLGFPAAH